MQIPVTVVTPQRKAAPQWSNFQKTSSWAQSEVSAQTQFLFFPWAFITWNLFIITAWETPIALSMSQACRVCHKLLTKERISPPTRKKSYCDQCSWMWTHFSPCQLMPLWVRKCVQWNELTGIWRQKLKGHQKC